jgi:hypothetical protein
MSTEDVEKVFGSHSGWLFLVLGLASLVACFTIPYAQDWFHCSAIVSILLGLAITFRSAIAKGVAYTKRNPFHVVQISFGAWAAVSIGYQAIVYLGKLLLPHALVKWVSSWMGWINNLQMLLDVHVAIFLVLISLLAKMILAAKRIQDLPEKAKAVEDAAAKVGNYAQNNAGQALNIVGRLLGLKEFSEARKNDHHDSSTDALAAIACNLGNWESHVRKHSSPARQSSILTEVWLRSQSAYFLEEGYEIGRKSMATNGRNFCFLLLATLDAFLKRANSDETVCYTAVTPVSPEDWYNWPHGYGADKRHFENEFVGDFQRVLREYLSQKASDRLEHSRYLLIAKDRSGNGGSKPKQFGWELSTETNFEKDVHGWVIPASVKLQALSVGVISSDNVLYKYGPKLHDYFTRTRKVEERTGDGKPVYITPMFSKRWDTSLELDIGTQPTFDVVEAFIAMASDDHWNAATKINSELRDSSVARSANEKCNREVEAKLVASLNAVEQFKHNGDGLVVSGDGSFLEWLQASHSVEANLAEISSECAQKFHRLRYHLLRVRDAYHFSLRKNALSKNLKVGNVFATYLHSKPKDCMVATLSIAQLGKLKNNNVQPEFHLFGTRKTKPPEGGSHKKPDWQLLVTTLLDYPFEVTRITLNDEPGHPAFKKHVEFLESLSPDVENNGEDTQMLRPLLDFIEESEEA